MQRRKVIVRKLGGKIIKGYVETIPERKDKKHISIISLTEGHHRSQTGDQGLIFCAKVFGRQRI